MSENGLIQRILSDATATAESIVQKAQAEAAENKNAAVAAAMDKRQAYDIVLQEESKKIIERRLTLAEIDAKKTILSAKVKCVDNAFDAAQKMLCRLDKKAYADFVEKALKNYAQTGDTVVLSKNCPVDRAELTKSRVFADKKLVLSKTDGDFCGGVVLVGKKYDTSITFETLLNEKKTALQGAVLAQLI